MRAEQLTSPLAYHGEGPVWSERWGGLRWVDMLAGDVLSLGADGSIHRRHVGSLAAAVRPRQGGGAVMGIERGFALEDADGTVRYLNPLWTHDRVRMNEGACGPDGCFYCGSMACDGTPGAGAVYRLDPDGSMRVVVDNVTTSNGLDWAPDGSLAYYVDTHTRRVDVFDYARESGLTGRRPFVQIPREQGVPDGLTVDAEGGVWVALYGGGTVRRFTPGGALDAVVEVQARHVTACTLGGARLDELFVTTSRQNLEPGEDRFAGALFRTHVEVPGLPVREFSG